MRCAISKAQLSDAPEMARMQVSSWRDAYKGIVTPEDMDLVMTEDKALMRHEAKLRNSRTDIIHLIAKDEAGHIVGFSDAGPRRKEKGSSCSYEGAGEIYTLYILPEMQRKGIGRALVARVVTFLQEQGYKTLILEALDGNVSGRSFYEKLGGTLEKADDTKIGEKHYPCVAYVWPDIKVLA